MNRLFSLLILALIISASANAQIETSAFTSTGRAGVATTFATDYQCLGINPANLGWGTTVEDKTGAFTLMEGSYSIYSEALTKPELKDAISQFNTNQKFTMAQKRAAADAFTNTPLTLNIDLTPFAIAVQPEKVGGFAFGIKERVQWYSVFSQNTSEILFLGYNAPYFDIRLNEFIDTAGITQYDTTKVDSLVDRGIASNPQLFSEVLDGSQIGMSWYREFNLSYGGRVVNNDNFKLYAGLGVKYLRGMALLDVRSDAAGFHAYTAITPMININWGSAAANNPSADTINNSKIFPEPVGQGWGVDAGISAKIGERLTLGIALTDYGQMTWDVNVYKAEDDTLYDISSEGFNNYNIFTQADDIVGDSGVFNWNGQTSITTKLPAVLRGGASYVFITDKLEGGVDVVLPFNDEPGNYNKAVIALGGDVYPWPWLRLSSGVILGGNYGFNLPAGLTFVVGKGAWECGVASRDAITYFTQNRPTLSLSTGFLRFRF